MVPSSAGAAPLAPAGAVMVKGVRCAHGHFNRSDVAYCAVCGTAMGHPLELVDGPRPSLGNLVLADGSMVALDRDIVIGRDPLSHEAVAAGRAKSVVVDDPELSVSRAHAEIRLDGWDAKISDCGSSNGTDVISPDSQVPIRLEPNQSMTLVPGSKLMLGKYTVTFNA
jgi:hypothetical protein